MYNFGVAPGIYTLTENTLYTVEAFTDYLDHLTDDGLLTITRWVFDGLRLVSLAQEACARRAPFLAYVDVEPVMAPLAQDPRCRALLRQHGFDAVA